MIQSALIMICSGPILTLGILSSLGSFGGDRDDLFTRSLVAFFTFCIAVAVYRYGVVDLIGKNPTRNKFFYPFLLGGISSLLTALMLGIMTVVPPKPLLFDVTEVFHWLLGSILILMAFNRQPSCDTASDKNPSQV